jgi:hypothetical protein
MLNLHLCTQLHTRDLTFNVQATKTMLARLIVYPSVATANIVNLVLMRYSELSTGIHIKVTLLIERRLYSSFDSPF